MIPFSYRRISKDLISDLGDRTLIGESSVLLGPRYGGKRYVMYRLAELWKKAGSAPLIYLRLLAESPVVTERQVTQIVAAEVEKIDKDLEDSAQRPGELFGSIDRLMEKTKRPILLLASNIDGMAHHLARRFLEGVRSRIESRNLIAVLSGEDDFRDLVHGSKPEFACANHFVLQGFAEDEFDDYLRKYADNMGIEFADTREASDHLWRLTGGNTYLMRVVLWALTESRARNNISSRKQVTVEDIPGSLKTIGIPGVYGAHVFRHATDMIAGDPICWPDVEKLIAGQSVILTISEQAPTRLELAGVAVRETTSDGAWLKVPSQLVRAFMQRYYDNRRVGDLYAAMGQWEKAFEKYALLEPEGRMRPSGANDRAEVEATISMLSASLYTEAARGIESVKGLFAGGCRYVLGYEEVTFWQCNSWDYEKGWQLQQMQHSQNTVPEDATLAQILSLLPKGTLPPTGPLNLTEEWRPYAIVVVLPAFRLDQKVAVVLSNVETRAVISRERERLARRLLDIFVKAYEHALSVESLAQHLTIRDKHVEIMNSIFDSLGTGILNVRHVLQEAAEELRKLEYRRVFFCLVDPETRRIQGVLNSCDDCDVDVVKLTDWSLEDYEVDLQPYVIHTKKAKLVEDATRDRRANKDVVAATGMRALAIAPIINREDEAIGTVHVERVDGSIPSWDEASDLVAFGRQLAVAIEQIERVNLLESALDRIPEPIVIVDRIRHPIYANVPAAELFDIEEGWRKQRGNGGHLDPDDSGEISRLVEESLATSHRLVRHVTGIGNRSDYRGAVLTDIIPDWRVRRTAGGLLHIQELGYMHRVFQAAALVGESNDASVAMRAMLEAAKLLGHNWGRLYYVDPADADQFVSVLSFGYEDPSIELEFSTGKVNLRRSADPRNVDWLCVDRREPLVLCCNETMDDGDIYVTRYGLKAINVRYPFQPSQIKKEPGDFWIEFPLIAEENVLGKLCLQCDESLRPEDFELLKLLSDTAAELFEGFLRRAQESTQRENLIKVSVAEKTMATTAHNIAASRSAGTRG